MQKWPKLNDLVDQIFVDNMVNEFIHRTGCWPEGYFFANRDRVAQWAGTSTPFLSSADPKNHQGALKYFQEINAN